MLSKSGVHAIRALTFLAGMPEGHYRGAARLANAIQSPPNYLGKLLQLMARDGLVKSQKGLGGGFRLARPPRDISIYDVMRSIEDVGRLEKCVFGGVCDPDAIPCAVHERWSRVRDEYLALMRTTSILDLRTDGGRRTFDRGRPQPTQEDI